MWHKQMLGCLIQMQTSLMRLLPQICDPMPCMLLWQVCVPYSMVQSVNDQVSHTLCMQIVEILTDALTLPETPIPTKVARLFLASDVLHNSTAPVRNASRYRSHLETSLPDIFESLQVCTTSLLAVPVCTLLQVALLCEKAESLT